MTAAAVPTTRPRPRSRASAIVGVCVLTAVVAAVVAMAVAAIGKGLGVPLEAAPQDAPAPEAIPLAAFAMMVISSAAVGTLIALACARWARRPERAYLITTLVLTAMSFAPSVTAGHATVATKVVLCLTHVAAAAIIIPTVARRLASSAAE